MMINFFLGFIIVGLILLVAQINMSYCSFLIVLGWLFQTELCPSELDD